MNISLSKRAETMLRSKLGPEQFLRIGITEGGCAGLIYNAEIADEMKEGEKVVHAAGAVRIVAGEAVEKYLEGL